MWRLEGDEEKEEDKRSLESRVWKDGDEEENEINRLLKPNKQWRSRDDEKSTFSTLSLLFIRPHFIFTLRLSLSLTLSLDK